MHFTSRQEDRLSEPQKSIPEAIHLLSKNIKQLKTLSDPGLYRRPHPPLLFCYIIATVTWVEHSMHDLWPQLGLGRVLIGLPCWKCRNLYSCRWCISEHAYSKRAPQTPESWLSMADWIIIASYRFLHVVEHQAAEATEATFGAATQYTPVILSQFPITVGWFDVGIEFGTVRQDAWEKQLQLCKEA